MTHLAYMKDGYFAKNDSDRLRCLFDQVLSYFLNGVSASKDLIRELPVRLSDGFEVDLFSLFWGVRKLGGYEFVSRNKLWEFVAKECGLDRLVSIHGGALEAVYVKYLRDLDQWLSRWGFIDVKLENGEVSVFEKLDSLFRELRGCKWDLPNVGLERGKKGDGSVERALEFKGGLDFDMNAEPGFSGTDNADEKEDFLCGFDLNIAQDDVNYEEIDNADDKDEYFCGFDLNIAQTEIGVSGIDNADDKDEYFGGFDLNIAQTELEFSRDNSFDAKVENVSGLDFEMAKTEMGLSRINNVDAKVENFSGMDENRIDLPCNIAVNKVDVPSIKDDDKRDVLCPTNVLGFQGPINEHKDKSDIDNNTMIIDKSNVKNVRSRKRKNEEPISMSETLDWLANAARNPHDVTIGSIPRSSKWKKYKGNEAWKQVLLVKETLFAKQYVNSVNKVHCSQKKRHTMHPSMYEDDKIPIHLSSKRIRCSQRVSSVKACSCPGCKSCSSSQNKRVKKSPHILEIREIQDDECEDLDIESDIVRAEVPEWTGVVYESDPKWLGTQMWPPPEDNNSKHQANNVVIGKGRQSLCSCLNRGSVDCVRFHIAENRTKVKHTLGPLFYKWKFNHMGEEASVSSWSVEEEAEFRSLVVLARQDLTDRSKSRHEIMSNFWRRATESIPCKTKDILVNYYFNVFVLRRRSYQNRINPDFIDSDDDEHDMGCEKIQTLSVKCSNDTQFITLES